MAVYPTHQNRHFFVVNKFQENTQTVEVDGEDQEVPYVLSPSDSDGTIQVKCFGEGKGACLYFVYKGKGDSILTTDKIAIKNLNYAKAIDAWDMVTPMTIKVITLDQNVNGGNPIAGEDYVLRINFRQFFGPGDEHTYVKDAVVRASTNMTPEAFYKAMADALNRSFSREAGATKTTNPYLKFVGSTSCLTIWELPQGWTQGVQSMERVLFDVFPTTVLDGRNDVIWGKVDDRTYEKYRDDGEGGTEPMIYVAPDSTTDPVTEEKQGIRVGYSDTSTGTGNGRAIADLEWFCMGERGDQYRMMGYPNYIPTQYMVDPNEQYHVLELHFALTDWGVDSYRSEKDITIVSTSKSELNKVIDAINELAGTEIAELSE